MLTIPTTDQFFDRYQSFADIDAVRVGFAMEDAVRVVGTPDESSWPARDYAPAIMLLTAHLLSEERINDLMTSAGGAHISREKVGDVEITYNVARVNGTNGGGVLYGSTDYGRRFEVMRRGLFAGPVIL